MLFELKKTKKKQFTLQCLAWNIFNRWRQESSIAAFSWNPKKFESFEVAFGKSSPIEKTEINFVLIR